MQNIFGDSLLIGYFCAGLNGAVRLGYVLSLPSSFKHSLKKKKAVTVGVSGLFIADFNNFMP